MPTRVTAATRSAPGPERALAQRFDEPGMRFGFGGRDPGRERAGARGWHPAAGGGAAVEAGRDHRQREALLPAPHQFQIDLCQQLRIEQRAMLCAPRIVDAEAAAERVEAVLC